MEERPSAQTGEGDGARPWRTKRLRLHPLGHGRPLKGWDTLRRAVLKDRFGSFLDDGLDRGRRWVQARDEGRKAGEEALVRG